ncbi:hypothetical protein BH20ACI2_BH20ACI2_26170 [soil metagenome]
MKLHSDFRDYYEHAIGHGVDEKVRYNRYQKAVSINLKSHLQEISMYLANILVEQKEVDSVDDRHRIEQHGFDLKTSFRHRN